MLRRSGLNPVIVRCNKDRAGGIGYKRLKHNKKSRSPQKFFMKEGFFCCVFVRRTVYT